MYFYITLRLFLGEIEKMDSNLYQADNEEEAYKKALIGECHYYDSEEKIEEAYESGRKYNEIWDGGMYVYRIFNCKHVTDEDAEVMKKYMNVL